MDSNTLKPQASLLSPVARMSSPVDLRRQVSQNIKDKLLDAASKRVDKLASTMRAGKHPR